MLDVESCLPPMRLSSLFTAFSLRCTLSDGEYKDLHETSLQEKAINVVKI